MFAIKYFIIQPKLLECENNSIAYLYSPHAKRLLVILKVDPVQSPTALPKNSKHGFVTSDSKFSSLMISYPAEGNLDVKGEEMSLRQVYAMLHAILIS